MVGVHVSRHLASVADRAEDARRAQQARHAAAVLLREADLADERFWEEVEVYGRELFSIEAAMTSVQDTADRLESELRQRPDILPWLIRSCAEWSEQRDSRDWSRVLGWRQNYGGLPAWFPARAVANAIATAFPHVVPESEPRQDADQTESLAAQVLYDATRAV